MLIAGKIYDGQDWFTLHYLGRNSVTDFDKAAILFEKAARFMEIANKAIEQANKHFKMANDLIDTKPKLRVIDGDKKTPK